MPTGAESYLTDMTTAALLFQVIWLSTYNVIPPHFRPEANQLHENVHTSN